MTVIIAADHRGFLLKKELLALTQCGSHDLSWLDVGTDSEARTDYPIFAKKALAEFQKKAGTRMVLLCGTGAGMAICANRVPGVRAAVAWDSIVARRIREEDDANVLVIPSDYVDAGLAREIVCAWISAQFKGGRYAERITMIDS